MRLAALKPPQLRTTESSAHRSATWLELFYDLVFVVAVAGLGHRLLEHPDWQHGLAYVGLFIPVWWAWAGFTFYADRYDTDDFGQRNLAAGQIMAVAFMAAAISGDVADSTFAFAAAYSAARLILLLMYARARRHVPETRDLTTGYIVGHGIGVGFWIVSMAVPPPARFVLWAIGLLIDFYTPYHLREIQKKVPLDVSHLPERFGLFTILVLGESIAAVVAGLSHEGWETGPFVGAVLGIFIATGLWWLYFDNSEGTVVRRKKEQRTAWKPTVWIYSHLPLAIALVATGIGLEFIVTGHLDTGERWIVTLGLAFSLVFLAVMHVATEGAAERRDDLKTRVRLLAAGAVIVVGIVGAGLDENVFALLLAIVVGSQVALDLLLRSDEEPVLEAASG
jgi:low temperature requirement protein LtrA